jgi:hypothetical protein
MTAPIGAMVQLHVDLVATVRIGDVIETQTGRRYSVLGVREQQRGRHAGRQHLQCLVVPQDFQPLTAGPLPPDLTPKVHRIRWYARGKRSGK